MPTWLVESYWPTAAGSPDPAAGRLLRAAETLGGAFVGVVHIPNDEMALWRVEAAAPDAVAAIFAAAEVEFHRVVEVVDHPAPIGVQEAGTP